MLAQHMEDGIWTRWEGYARTGHIGALKALSDFANNFTYSIRTAGMMSYVIALKINLSSSIWSKRKLGRAGVPPGGVGIYLVVVSFERLWSVN